ncbi:MAG: hypothetical protein HOF33_10205 [Rhodospirillaceae bacterium]|nr:hypothetical protein [Rhodospirillaceae bacterium]
MMTLHARLAESSAQNSSTTVAAIKRRLAERFGVTHATIEIEPVEIETGDAG